MYYNVQTTTTTPTKTALPAFSSLGYKQDAIRNDVNDITKPGQHALPICILLVPHQLGNGWQCGHDHTGPNLTDESFMRNLSFLPVVTAAVCHFYLLLRVSSGHHFCTFGGCLEQRKQCWCLAAFALLYVCEIHPVWRVPVLFLIAYKKLMSFSSRYAFPESWFPLHWQSLASCPCFLLPINTPADHSITLKDT